MYGKRERDTVLFRGSVKQYMLSNAVVLWKLWATVGSFLGLFWSVFYIQGQVHGRRVGMNGAMLHLSCSQATPMLHFLCMLYIHVHVLYVQYIIIKHV